MNTPPILETDPARLQKVTAFPHPQTVALGAAIASGVFAHPDDRELFTAIVILNEALVELADRLAHIETLMALRGDIQTYRNALSTGAVLRSANEKLMAFGELLLREPGVDPDYAPLAPKSKRN